MSVPSKRSLLAMDLEQMTVAELKEILRSLNLPLVGNEAELIEKIQGTTGESKKQTGEIIDTVFAALASTICTNGRFSYPGFGTFTVRERKARTGRNPQTGDPIRIPKSKTVAFKASPSLKSDL